MTSLHQLQDVKHPVYAREIHNAKNIHCTCTVYTQNKVCKLDIHSIKRVFYFTSLLYWAPRVNSAGSKRKPKEVVTSLLFALYEVLPPALRLGSSICMYDKVNSSLAARENLNCVADESSVSSSSNVPLCCWLPF